MRKMRFGDLETDLMRRFNDIKFVISANMTLNVILTLIALITVHVALCEYVKPKYTEEE